MKKKNFLLRLVYFDLLGNILQSRSFWENISFWNSWRSNPSNVNKMTLLLFVCGCFNCLIHLMMTSILSRCIQRVHIGHLTLLFSLLHREKKDKFNSNVCRKSEQFIEESLVFHIVLAPRLDYDFDFLFFSSPSERTKEDKSENDFRTCFFFFISK